MSSKKNAKNHSVLIYFIIGIVAVGLLTWSIDQFSKIMVCGLQFDGQTIKELGEIFDKNAGDVKHVLLNAKNSVWGHQLILHEKFIEKKPIQIWFGMLVTMLEVDFIENELPSPANFIQQVLNTSNLLNSSVGPRNILLDLLRKKEDSHVPADVQRFEDTEWHLQKRHTIFERNTSKGRFVSILLQRRQFQRHCYLQAAMMASHYAVSLSTKENAGIIDVRKFVIRSFRGKRFLSHLNNEGGKSYEVLEDIISKNTKIKELSELNITLSSVDQDFLDEHGSILISDFHMFNGFCEGNLNKTNNKEYIYDIAIPYNRSNPAERRLHAMIIVGVDESLTGKKMFLVQNWYKSAQFIQMSDKFILSRKSRLHCLESIESEKELPKRFPTQRAFFDESEQDGEDSVLEGVADQN